MAFTGSTVIGRQLTTLASEHMTPVLMELGGHAPVIVCEDTAGHCGLVGIRPDGSQYAIGDNAYSKSEMAGVCFSPDGETLFVNIQYPGMTIAITGDWALLQA